MYLCTELSKFSKVGKFSAYKLPLRNLPEGVHKYEYELGTGFFQDMENEDVRRGDVHVELTVRHEHDTYYLDFEMKGMLIIPCDRCLDDLEHEVDTKYSLRVKYGEEYSDETDDLLIIPESDTYLNVAYMIYDTVVLTIPLKHVHPFGKCNRAMSAQLRKHSINSFDDEDFDDELLDDNLDDEVNDAPTDPRWDALKNTNNDNN